MSSEPTPTEEATPTDTVPVDADGNVDKTGERVQKIRNKLARDSADGKKKSFKLAENKSRNVLRMLWEVRGGTWSYGKA